MTYRYPYMYAGELCDFDDECMMALELDRLIQEADGIVVPLGFDLSDPQCDE